MNAPTATFTVGVAGIGNETVQTNGTNKTLDDHTTILDHHTTILDHHTATLNRVESTINSHSSILEDYEE